MQNSAKKIFGFTMGATDGEIGEVKDFYFDDRNWEIRYLVIETGSWLIGRKVLISPVAVQSPEWDSNVLPVNHTKDQIRNSPDFDAEKPLSRQQEEALYGHYAWPYYGGSGFTTTGMMAGGVAPSLPFDEQVADAAHQPDSELEEETSLRSIRHLIGYTVHATDGELGEVADFLIDDANWKVTHLVIETGNWFAGTKILAPVSQILRMERESSGVYLNSDLKSFEDSPEFNF